MRRINLPQGWPAVGIGLEVGRVPDRGLLVAHEGAPTAALFRPTGPMPDVTFALPSHSDLKVVDSERVSFLSREGQSASVFKIEARATQSETMLPFGVSSALCVEGGWLVSRLYRGNLFHRVSISGEIVQAFGTTRVPNACSAKSWAGQIDDAIAMSGTLTSTGANAFVFVYDALPLVQAYDIGGRELWSTMLQDHQVPSSSVLEGQWKDIQARNPNMSQVKGLVTPLNASVAIGPHIAILHHPVGGSATRRLSLLEVSGPWHGSMEVKKAVVAIVYDGDRLLGVRELRSGTLALEAVQ